MSVLPKYAHGRISIPWWYGLGYLFGWGSAAIIGIRRVTTMEIILTTESIIALVVCAFIGSVLFVLPMALSKFAKQKTDAEKLKRKIAEEGRDPTDLAQLTASERWEIQKAQKFDRIFMFAFGLNVILATALTCAILILAQDRIGADSWVKFGVYGIALALICAWIIYELVIKAVAAGEWEKKSAEAFRVSKAVADKVAEMNGGYAALVKKFIASGISKKEAEKMAKDAIIADPTLLDKVE